MDNNQQSDLQKLKDYEEKLKRYQESDVQKNQNTVNENVNNNSSYRSLAYKVRNPFRGV